MKDKSKALIGAALLVIVAFCVLFGSVEQTNRSENQLPIAPQKLQAPDVTLLDVHTNKPVRISDITGKHLVVLSFWATWCGPCRQELPELNELSKRYAGRVEFYGVASTDTPKQAKQFADQNGYTFPILSDVDQKGAREYDAESLPHMVIIDRDRYVRVMSEGYGPDSPKQITNTLDALLNGA